MHGILNLLNDNIGSLTAIDACENIMSLVKLGNRHKITGTLWYETDKQCEESCWYHLGTEHIAPSYLNSPWVAVRHKTVHTLTNALNNRLGVLTKYHEVDKINYKLAEDDSKLVPADKHTTNLIRSYLTDVHRTDGRCQAYANTTDDTIDIESNKEFKYRHATIKEKHLRIHTAQGRDKEENTCDDK